MLTHAIIVSVNTVGILQSRKVLKDLYKRFVETDRVFNTLSQFPQAFLIQTFQTLNLSMQNSYSGSGFFSGIF
jgi:hypothetical protein